MHLIHFLQDWYHGQDKLELTGVITGLLCVYLAAINNIWNWPFAIVSVAIYIFIFYSKQLYADMGLQVYFILINTYGWYYWSRRPMHEAKVPVKRISRRQILWSVLIIALCTPLLGLVLIRLAPVLHYKPAAFPYLDSFCAACSVIAQIFMARKILENWLLWVFVDIIYVGVYLFKDLHDTAFMYAVYIAIALLGFFDWRKDYRAQAKSST